jgi:beta-galactosidase
MFPDRTPSPGLGEFKKVVEPLRISADWRARTIEVRNLHHTRDTGYLRWEWLLEEDGAELGRGELAVPVIRAGQAGSVEWPDELTRVVDQVGTGEVWLTVSAVTGEAESWAPAGHEVAWAQERIGGSGTHKAASGSGAHEVAGGSGAAAGIGAAGIGAEVDGG